MFEYNRELISQSRRKYIICNFICVVLSLITFFFIRDESEGEGLLLLVITLSQLLTCGRYFIVRTMYREQIVINEPVSLSNNQSLSKWKSFIVKGMQVILFNIIQVVASYSIILIFTSYGSEVTLLLINFVVSIIVSLILFLFDFVFVNRIKKNFYEEWFMIFICIMPFVLIEYPRNNIALIYMGMFVVSIVINIGRVRRAYL